MTRLYGILHRHLRSPAFALTVFVLVAAVTAINATVFGAIDMLRWKWLPYAADDSLVQLNLRLTKFDNNDSGLSELYRAQLALDTATFRGVAGFVDVNRTRSDDEGRPWRITQVTSQLDAVLGIAPALGRGIEDADAHDGADRVLVISDALWRRRFNADPDILGHTVRLGDRTDTIVGVMPRGFAFPDTRTDAWRPFVPPTKKAAVAGIGQNGELDAACRRQRDLGDGEKGTAGDQRQDDQQLLRKAHGALLPGCGPQYSPAAGRRRKACPAGRAWCGLIR